MLENVLCVLTGFDDLKVERKAGIFLVYPEKKVLNFAGRNHGVFIWLLTAKRGCDPVRRDCGAIHVQRLYCAEDHVNGSDGG